MRHMRFSSFSRLSFAWTIGLSSAIVGCLPTAPVVEPPAGAFPCFVSDILVPSCGALIGASTPSSDGTFDYSVGLAEYEAIAQRTPDILHFYKRGAKGFPTAAEASMAQRPGQVPSTLFYNWKPSTTQTWSAVAAGGADVAIDQVADGLLAYPYKVFLSIFHEPENDEKGPGSGMTATDYVAMYRHVVERLRARGVANAVFVMDYIGYVRWASRVDAFYPGDDVVDWIGYNPYSFGGETSIDRLVNQPGNWWPGFYSWATAKAPGKPIMLGEWGFETAAQPNAAAVLDAAVPILRTQFPAIKAFVYWNGAIGKLDFRLGFPTAAGASFGAAYARFVGDAYFATTTPTVDPNAVDPNAVDPNAGLIPASRGPASDASGADEALRRPTTDVR